MADRAIADIVADLRKMYPLIFRWRVNDVLAVLDDWQRQANEIAELEEYAKEGWRLAALHEQRKLESDAAADAADAEVEALRALVRYWKRYGIPGRSKELQAVLDRTLADPPLATDAYVKYSDPPLAEPTKET